MLFFLASLSDITPFGVDRIAKPSPFCIFGMLVAFEYILLPGFDTLLISFITGVPS